MEIFQDILSQLSDEINTIQSSLDEINELTVTITKIPAPPFNEDRRAEFVREYFELLGYSTRIDKEGNVLAHRDNLSDPIVLSAHLDTVFDLEEIEIEADGDILRAPGIGDDSRGLANLLFIAKLLYNTKYVDRLLFVATVGEEGKGDLRGVKALFSDDNKYGIKAFITIDGSGSSRIVDQGIGSYRYRLHVRGPGGHSFGSFGTVNPLFVLGNFMSEFANLEIDDNIKTTYSLGVIGGGTAINAIPEHVWVDIDLRSEKTEELDKLKTQLDDIIEEACDTENKARNGGIEYEFEQIGLRPAGKLVANASIRNAIKTVHEYLDLEINYTASSTDANVPLNKSIPAISVAGVEESGRAHTLDEWIDASEESLTPIIRNLLLTCLLTEIY